MSSRTAIAGNGSSRRGERAVKDDPKALDTLWAKNCGRLGDLMGAPQLLIDPARLVLRASPLARAVLDEPSPVRIIDDVLCGATVNVVQRLEQFLADIGERHQTIVLDDESSSHWVILGGWRVDYGRDGAIFLHCSASIPARPVGDTDLALHFDLTRAECLVLDQIIRLNKPRQVAQVLDISVLTVRSHIKQLHTKMQVRTTEQLIQKARAFCDWPEGNA